MQDDDEEHRGSWWRRLLATLGILRSGGCPPNLTPEQDLEIAYRVSADGDLPHATHHVAAVLMVDPMDRRATQLLDRLISKCGESSIDPLTLAPLKRNNWAGTIAVRCYVLHALGTHAESLDLLHQLAYGDRDRPWWKWLAKWAEDPQVAAAIKPEAAAGMLAPIVMKFPGVIVTDPAARIELESTLSAVTTLVTAHPQHEMLRFVHSSVLRKLGRLDEALSVATAWDAQNPSWHSAITLAMARQAKEDVDGAVAAYEAAMQRDPKDATAPADAAELLASHARFDESLRYCERAMRNDPDKKTAAWWLAALIRGRSGDDAPFKELAGIRKKHPKLRPPSNDALRRLGPYCSYLPEPSEATINMMRDLIAKLPNPKTIKSFRLGLTSIEAPSSRYAMDRTLGRDRNGIEVDAGEIPQPDPRIPRGDVDWLIWKYDGNNPTPALPEPSAPLVDAVAELASSPYELVDWMRRGRGIAKDLVDRFGSPGEIASELLATMVHPPPTPQGSLEWEWIRKIQFAAAVVASQLDSGWSDSTRRRALVSLLRGPLDWTTEAGVIMAAHLATEPEMTADDRRDIAALLSELSNNRPSVGYFCCEDALEWAESRVPDFAASRAKR